MMSLISQQYGSMGSAEVSYKPRAAFWFKIIVAKKVLKKIKYQLAEISLAFH